MLHCDLTPLSRSSVFIVQNEDTLPVFRRELCEKETTLGHPFGDLLSQHLHRKHGLSQSKLAAGILQDPAVIGKMCKGQRLNGPQARANGCWRSSAGCANRGR